MKFICTAAADDGGVCHSVERVREGGSGFNEDFFHYIFIMLSDDEELRESEWVHGGANET